MNNDYHLSSKPSLTETINSLFTTEDSYGNIFDELELDVRKFSEGRHVSGYRSSVVDIAKSRHSELTGNTIPSTPVEFNRYVEKLRTNLVPYCASTSSPKYIGHMTSALPLFLQPLSKLLVAMNQNVVKEETSNIFTSVERQVTGMIHHLVYQHEQDFYDKWMHNSNGTLGQVCSGGTIANITALWCARNTYIMEKNNAELSALGAVEYLERPDKCNCVVLVSKRGHYSIGKAMDLLGIGRNSLITIDTDESQKIRLDLLEKKCAELKENNIGILAIVGIAGSTETGSIDPLDELSRISRRYGAHYHVDAAWGGATLMSDSYRPLMKGIECADSVTIDAHKQMYVPMGTGLVVFKNPIQASSIQSSANYILRKNSNDIGSRTLEGSRPANSLLLHACLQTIGKNGYEMLINSSIEKTKYFADAIEQHNDFELITRPQLCLLTYRYVPRCIQNSIKTASSDAVGKINQSLNNLNIQLQEMQWRDGQSFVSRTMFEVPKYGNDRIVVLRVVLANPLTTKSILDEVLVEQAAIARKLEESVPMESELAGV